MKGYCTAIIFALSAAVISPASARSAIDAIVSNDDSGSAGSPPLSSGSSGAAGNSDYLECVPFARQLSGLQIYGDAHTWWKQAKGRYARGFEPRVGAVLAIKPHGNSTLGHVATVTQIVDSRTILVSHANWSVPGKIERDVSVLDVSPENDWSEVRVWYGPAHNLGASHWPVAGFIYNAQPGSLPDAGSSRIASQAESAPPLSEGKKKGRHSDPIGAIIAGNY